jgi:hypothetical protein
MTGASPVSDRFGRWTLAWLVLLYLLAMLGFAAYILHFFGEAYCVGVSLVSIWPLIMASRMLMHWQGARNRELVYLLALLVLVVAGLVAIVRNAYEIGADSMHAQDVECERFVAALRADTAFAKVEVFVSGKHIFWLRGVVASENDLQRLVKMASRCRLITWELEVRVARSPSRLGTMASPIILSRFTTIFSGLRGRQTQCAK